MDHYNGRRALTTSGANRSRGRDVTITQEEERLGEGSPAGTTGDSQRAEKLAHQPSGIDFATT